MIVSHILAERLEYTHPKGEIPNNNRVSRITVCIENQFKFLQIAGNTYWDWVGTFFISVAGLMVTGL